LKNSLNQPISIIKEDPEFILFEVTKKAVTMKDYRFAYMVKSIIV